MMNKRMKRQDQVWQAVQAAASAFVPHYRELNRQILQEEGMNGADWMACFAAYGVAPERLTAEYFCAISPFNLPSRRQKMLTDAVEHGFLKAHDDATFEITPKGEHGFLRFYEEIQRFIGEMTPLAAGEAERLATLLGKIVAATREADLPAQPRLLTILAAVVPPPDAPALVRAEQFLTDLGLYRDDAHHAAWEHLGVSGQAWEALTYVWREQASGTAELLEQLESRGLDEAGWTAVLQEGVAQGWLEEENGRYLLTDAGKAVREQAEADTEHNFFVSWQSVTDEELGELQALLEMLGDNLKAMAPVAA